jgi:hypothetical protein
VVAAALAVVLAIQRGRKTDAKELSLLLAAERNRVADTALRAATARSGGHSAVDISRLVELVLRPQRRQPPALMVETALEPIHLSTAEASALAPVVTELAGSAVEPRPDRPTPRTVLVSLCRVDTGYEFSVSATEGRPTADQELVAARLKEINGHLEILVGSESWFGRGYQYRVTVTTE